MNDRTDPADERGRISRRTILRNVAWAGAATAVGGVALTACGDDSGGFTTDAKPKPASEATKAANKKVRDSLPFANRDDFADASRGLVKRPDTLIIKTADGRIAWDMESYKKFINDDAESPDTVNPSLWRNAKLNMHYGLYKVTDRIYQVRGYDLSNISFIQGDLEWIVFDPLVSTETAKAALDLINAELGARPVTAVIISHPHTDHYGGIRGVVSQADVDAGKARIVVPQGFLEHAVSENVIAGNVMSRRAVYMYGALLPRGPQGGVNAGLGQTLSNGHGQPDAADRGDLHDRHRADDRRRADGVPDDAGHRGAGGDEYLLPPVQGHVDGGEHHQHDAQHPHPARGAGP
ncbi:MBL fold metallo-hydrolase [Gordonia crocea]|uniref:Metallo-beta-lactamase domain-containing protein n=1 Tax=Gordonia crocea TaxID=589162 RepID=A0A7I9UWJ7_9ACTN|nr:MBL fold metallo-hydrolase [Gordonia crocea]GED97313.1 hypothetical protein nbrc107697_13520 [Gordonia crocea]